MIRTIAVCLCLPGGAVVVQGDETGAESRGPGASQLRQRIRKAEPHAIITWSGEQRITLNEPIVIDKPLTLRGLKAKIADGQKHHGIIIESTGVEISHFDLIGNGERGAVPIKASVGGFVIRNGKVADCERHGIWIQGDIDGGLVRDIVSQNLHRDTVSLVGRRNKARNVVIEDIRAYGSDIRGALEIADGCENIVARNIYAENCAYGVSAMEDHGDPERDLNTNVSVEGVVAVNCEVAVVTRTRPMAHADLTVCDVTARGCAMAIQIRHIKNVNVSGVRVIDHPAGSPPVQVTGCDGLTIRDVTIDGSRHDGAGIVIANCDHALIDGAVLRGEVSALNSGLVYRLTEPRAYSGLRISGVAAFPAGERGIVLEQTRAKASLSSYTITGNAASVVDAIGDASQRIGGNTNE